MNCEQHLIELKSLNENSLFKRNLVLLDGTICNRCICEIVEIQHENENNSIKLFNKNFKHLLELNENVNLLTIKYCHTKKIIKLRKEIIPEYLYDIQPLYIIPKSHDGKFQSINEGNSKEDALEKIDLAMQLAQCVISQKLMEIVHEETSFILQKCQVFESSYDVDYLRLLNQWELYDEIAKEIVQRYGADIINRRKFIGFLSCTRFLGLADNEDYSYSNIKNKTQANPSLGSGFLALLGSGCFYTWPNKLSKIAASFQNKRIVNIKHELDDSNYRKTYGGCFSTCLGTLIHEIGHVFDCGHTLTGLMGNDIDYVHRFFICEKFTEIMPKRNVSNCEQASSIESNKNSFNGCTKIKKNGSFLDQYHAQKNNDMTFFEKNCLITFAYHCWFTQIKYSGAIKYDESNRKVLSDHQLMLVEIRDSDSLLKNYWDLTTNSINTFQIPENTILKNITLFAININGCILKKCLN